MEQLKRLIEGRVVFNERISGHTTFKIGGPARVWIEPEGQEDLRKALKVCSKSRMPVYIIGSGSNLLVDDKKIQAAVVSLSSPGFRYVRLEGDTVAAGAGAPLASILNICAEKGLTGLEFCAGIPGTVGGAVLMNAGASPRAGYSNVGNFLVDLTVMDSRGTIKNFLGKELKFGYRDSRTGGNILLEARFKLRRAKKERVRKLLRATLERKRASQELSRPSAGCVFKNPCGGFISAGKLIALTGLQGKALGGARVSEKNANYIINTDSARFRDVTGLMDIIKTTVKKEFNLELEPEIKVWQ